MAYIGNTPAEAFSSFQKQDFTTSATTSYTLDHPVSNQNEIALFINFVRQEPTAAYTASGTTLTLTSATSSSDDMYCIYLGKAVQTVNPPNASVGTAQLASEAVTNSKVASSIITGQTAETSIATDDTVLIHDTSAGALRKMTRANFVSGIGGTNTPAFHATMSADQSISTSTNTKLVYNTETFDTDGCYDNSSNYRFTPTSAGKYQVGMQVRFNGSALQEVRLSFQKNGSEHKRIGFSQADTALNQSFTVFTTIIELNGSSDYVEAFVRCTGSTFIYGNNSDNYFYAYKLIT